MKQNELNLKHSSFTEKDILERPELIRPFYEDKCKRIHKIISSHKDRTVESLKIKLNSLDVFKLLCSQPQIVNRVAFEIRNAEYNMDEPDSFDLSKKIFQCQGHNVMCDKQDIKYKICFADYSPNSCFYANEIETPGRPAREWISVVMHSADSLGIDIMDIFQLNYENFKPIYDYSNVGFEVASEYNTIVDFYKVKNGYEKAKEVGLLSLNSYGFRKYTFLEGNWIEEKQ